MTKKITVVGGGFAGLSSASYLAKDGYEVTLLEKNDQVGGRARVLESGGFRFDMGPSWYWMPEVFEKFFNDFGSTVKDHYELVRLDPAYRVFFSKNEVIDVPGSWEKILELFESIESGASGKLQKFMTEAQRKYELGMNKMVHQTGDNLLDYVSTELFVGLFQNEVFSSITKHIKRFFKDPKLIQLLEFPVLFLGAKPENTPALYSLMNYADLKLGTWYPMGGMGSVVEGMKNVFLDLGGKIRTGEEVTDFSMGNHTISSVKSKQDLYTSDAVIGGADYNFIEQNLLPKEFRTYSPKYWDKRTLAPSALLFYLGIDKKLEGLQHHNLFFDADFSEHAAAIYDNPSWPENPLFYVSVSSMTDQVVAPEGKENVVILVPLAPGIEDSEENREKCFNLIMERFENLTNQSIREHIIERHTFGQNEFIQDYHSFKGNAYGLANTLMQTGPLKPKLKSKKVKNLFYTGQLTVPGPGVPPSLISGKIAATEVHKYLHS